MLGSKMMTQLLTWITGRYVGTDEFENKYYESKRSADFFGRKRRWVIFTGRTEPTKVPGQWHGWLHHIRDTPADQLRLHWQKTHLPNLSGTKFSYFPQPDNRFLAPSYEQWKPNQITTPQEKVKK
jgi:NADH:ubiquinone oxidoreductase subunit